MTATQISLVQMYSGQRGTVRELIEDMRNLNRRLEEAISDPSWLSVHTALTEEKHRYAGDET